MEQGACESHEDGTRGAGTPSARGVVRTLESLFAEVHRSRGHELPLLNPRLAVEAVGFREWQGLAVGALVTPGSLLLVILPCSVPLAPLPTGATEVFAFPSGEYEFHGHADPALGAYRQCSLFSPALAFEDQPAARAAAAAAVEALFAAPAARRVTRRGLLTGAG